MKPTRPVVLALALILVGCAGPAPSPAPDAVDHATRGDADCESRTGCRDGNGRAVAPGAASLGRSGTPVPA